MPGLLESFRPDVYVEGLKDIDLEDLRARGFRAILIDMDNTLLPWKDETVPAASAEWVEQAKSLGFGLCVVSNTHKPSRLNKIAGALGIPSIHRALKPRRSGFVRALELMQCKAEEAVVIGDQILTDILGGNLAGTFTILVNPMHPREFFGTKISRAIEKLLLVLLRETRAAGTNQGCDQSERAG